MDPLWQSQQNRLFRDQIPCCNKCGDELKFELQVMPQIFDKIEELRMVDWDTIVVYTCTSIDCMLNFDSDDSMYTPEFAYI